MNIHKTLFTTKNRRYIFVLVPFLLACQPQEENTTTTYPEDHWGEVTEALPNFYAASDVTTRHLELTKEWYEIRDKMLTASSLADSLGKGHFKTEIIY